jgi:nucleoid-associated protein YgaU
MPADITFRYRKSVLVTETTGDWVSTNPNVINTEENGTDVFHRVSQGDRLDALAFRYLGNANLWWVIAEFNDIFWFQNVQVGQTLRIPSFDRLYHELLR